MFYGSFQILSPNCLYSVEIRKDFSFKHTNNPLPNFRIKLFMKFEFYNGTEVEVGRRMLDS